MQTLMAELMQFSGLFKIKRPTDDDAGEGQNQVSSPTQANKSKWLRQEIQSLESRQCSGTKIQKIHQDKPLEKRLERRYTRYDEELANNEGNTELNTKGREG